MTPLSSDQALREAIAADETRLVAMEEERQQLGSRLDALRSELAALETQGAARRLPVVPDPSAPETSRTKVALFRQLFRGREDLYPKLWTNMTTHRKGYAPACAHEWVRGVCEKPRVKCGECPNQAFFPVTDQVILDHLQGRRVVGVYPLLTDEACWLLAADFDKSSWAEDVIAFAETCRTAAVPAAVERSRSGQGAHAWFFFAAPVAASLARKMGTYLLTQTMSRRHHLSMDSYDRLFPEPGHPPAWRLGRSWNTLSVSSSRLPVSGKPWSAPTLWQRGPEVHSSLSIDSRYSINGSPSWRCSSAWIRRQLGRLGLASASRREGWTSRCSRAWSGRGRSTTLSRRIDT